MWLTNEPNKPIEIPDSKLCEIGYELKDKITLQVMIFTCDGHKVKKPRNRRAF